MYHSLLYFSLLIYIAYNSICFVSLFSRFIVVVVVCLLPRNQQLDDLVLQLRKDVAKFKDAAE